MKWLKRFFRKKNVYRKEEKEVKQSVKTLEKLEKIKEETKQCMAVTKKGTRCTRKALEGHLYCKQHLHLEVQ